MITVQLLPVDAHWFEWHGGLAWINKRFRREENDMDCSSDIDAADAIFVRS